MSCHGCAEQFGFLKKEYGCPKCRFSYCKKCLRFSIKEPSTSKQLNVCFKCQEVSMGRTDPIAVISALHRLESMDDPAKPPITVYHQPARVMRLQELKRGLSFEDQQILERLESLKKDDSSAVNNSRRSSTGKPEEEIAERLAKLKGEEYNPQPKNSGALLRNVKPETEEDVMAKYSAEVEMDSKYHTSVVSDIEARLARLRGEPGRSANSEEYGASTQQATGTSKFDSITDGEELTEEEQIKLIMKKLQEELALEQRVGSTGGEMDTGGPSADVNQSAPAVEEFLSDDDDIDVDEICGICSDKRATLKCEECDDDIFCSACFQELHRELGEVHKATQFKKK